MDVYRVFSMTTNNSIVINSIVWSNGEYDYNIIYVESIKLY